MGGGKGSRGGKGGEGGSGRRGSGGDFEDADVRVANGVGVVIDVDLLDVGLALFEIQVFHVVLLAAVDVDGFFMNECERAGKINFTNDIGCAGDVDNHEIV